MQIKITALDQTGTWVEYEWELPGEKFPELASIAENVGPVKVYVKATKTESGYFVEGRAETKLDLICTRCLGTFTYDLEASFSDQFLPEGSFDHDQEDSLFNDQASTYQGDHLSLSPLITESLLLNLPMKVLCSSDCQGLCPDCGQNLNEETCQCVIDKPDPRLAPLADLFKNNSAREGDN